MRTGLTEKAKNNDASIYHLETGEGKDYELIWLHGWGQTHASLIGLSKLFNKFAKNHLFDLPGFGKTKMLHQGASTLDYASWLNAKLQPKTKLRILIGHSYGGRVSIQMAANYPDTIDGIILISGAGLKRKRGMLWKLRAGYLKFLGKLAKLGDAIFKTKLQKAYSTKFGSADYKNAGDLRGTFVSAVKENLIEEAKGVNVPTLLIYGEEDTDTPPEIGEKYNQLIKGSQYKILKGFDHLNILSHGANQCQSLISLFLEQFKAHD